MANLVRGTPELSVVHCCGQRSCWGQSEVNLLKNAQWIPNLVWSLLDQSVMCCCGQQSCTQETARVMPRSICVAIAHGDQILSEPLTRTVHYLRRWSRRGQPGSTRGQVTKNAIWLPNIVGISDQSVMLLQGQKPCRGQPEVNLHSHTV